MNFQKILPVLTSIGIILIIAAVRERSRTAAAIFASMPINIPLALWVVFGSGAPAEPQAEALFLRNIGVGLLTTLVWVGIVFVGLRFGFTLPSAIIVGYVAWAALTALWFGIGVMKIT
ncbi:MAG: hypothetical protein NTZ50_07975 [Chloroflexi bacterium]|nr:hypothetical protein [Chloroflexota bacterium]